MRRAAARVASRRGSSTTIRRSESHASSSSASGTSVVLPAPGGATSTARRRSASAARSASKVSVTGRSGSAGPGPGGTLSRWRASRRTGPGRQAPGSWVPASWWSVRSLRRRCATRPSSSPGRRPRLRRSTRVNTNAGRCVRPIARTTARSGSQNTRKSSASGPRNALVSSAPAVTTKLTLTSAPRKPSRMRAAVLSTQELSLV